ncbi:condensation domain-containing protein [Williamsia sp. MIQD14]|uniref:condensation domain-containing protein n=1 Tax=Williamsia sp. MIQD14 TaxID=3425703 RepID=UPI003DA0245A
MAVTEAVGTPEEPVLFGPDTFGLTAAQEEMWAAEQLQDDYSVTVAHYLDIVDDEGDGGHRFDPEVFRRGVIEGARLLETAYSRFVLVDGLPRQLVDPDVPFDVATVDLRSEPDPLAAAQEWMRADHTAPMDLTADPMAVSAFIRVADNRTFWYLRGHHIAFDGFAALTCLHEGVDRYNAAMSGREYEVAPRATLAEVTADDERYRSGSRREADGVYWAERVADLPAPVSLAREHSGRLHPDHAIAGRELSADTRAALDARAEQFGGSAAALLASAFGAYLAVVTGRDDIVLTLPITGRVTAKIKRAGGMVANMLPVRVDDVARHTPETLVAAVGAELTGCLRHQRYRFADIARIADIDERRVTFGPIVNLVFFDKPLDLHGARVSYHIVSSGILEDLRVNLYQAGAGLPIRVDLHGNSTMYSQAEIAAHLDGFLDFLDEFLARPGDPIAAMGVAARRDGLTVR